jgi:hypothetical protein
MFKEAMAIIEDKLRAAQSTPEPRDRLAMNTQDPSDDEGEGDEDDNNDEDEDEDVRMTDYEPKSSAELDELQRIAMEARQRLEQTINESVYVVASYPLLVTSIALNQTSSFSTVWM